MARPAHRDPNVAAPIELSVTLFALLLGTVGVLAGGIGIGLYMVTIGGS